MEGHGRSRKVKEGHGWSFTITRLTFQVKKVGGGWVVVAQTCEILRFSKGEKNRVVPHASIWMR